MNETKKMLEQEPYVITWHCNVLKLGRTHVSLGICQRTNQIAFVSVFQPNKPIDMEFLKVLIVQNVYAAEQCEDGTSCLDLDCPLNRVALSNFRKYKIKTMEELRKLHSRMREIQETLKLDVDSEGKTATWYDKPVYIIRKVKKEKKEDNKNA